MMKLPGNKIVFLLMCICLPVLVKAQQFRYQCLTDTVRQTGFYRIPVTPEMSAHMQIDYRDVRIWDNQKQQVPYIVRNDRPKWKNSSFKPFIMVENKLDDSGRSVMIIEKKVNYSIATLTLIIKNASVSRYAFLSGSNDRKNWFIISERILINESYETLADSSIHSISFPSSAYKYFRLIIENSKTDPLNIISIGYSENPDYKIPNNYSTNPKPRIIQTDSSNGVSYIKVLQQQPFRIDRVGFEIGGPTYFSRDFSILTSNNNVRNQYNYFTELARFTISSTSDYSTLIPAFKTASFYVSIENGDNPPLTIKNINTSQEYQEIITWLRSGTHYTIMMDAIDATAPKYDLQQFQDSIPSAVTQLAVGQIQSTPVVIESDKKTSFPAKWLWLIMAGAVILLAILTWRLTGEMRKKES